jgi:PAS domain S-box-containing protein
MRTVIIGGGKGCRAIIELVRGHFLKELPLDILTVADQDVEAPGMILARAQGIKTTADMKEALLTPELDLVIELTGKDEVLESINAAVSPGVRVFDHVFAKLFVDLATAQDEQSRQLREITELEEKIAEDRLFLQSVFDTMPQLVAVLDRKKILTRINAGLSLFTGLSVDEAVGRDCAQLFAGTELSASCQQSISLLDDVLESDQLRSFVWQAPPPTETVWEVTHAPILGKDGKTEEVLSTWRRITEQAILQLKIDAAENRFNSFMDSAHDWISIKDLDGRYVAVNKIAAQSLHLSVEDFIGKRPEDVLPHDLAKMIVSHDKQVIQDGRHRSFSEIVPVDGRDQHFQTNRFPLEDYRGRTIGICTIMRNVTSEITLRKQLEQAGRLAAIGKLAAGVAHEINNPLTGVLAYAEDLKRSMAEDSPYKDDLAIVVRETLRCREIVKNLLDFARLEEPKLEPLDPILIVDHTIPLVSKLPQFRNIEIDRQHCADVPIIRGDPNQVQQVLLNLMLNAAEAMKGQGIISISVEFRDRENKSVITVEDNGPGIPENLMDKIFEPFFSTKGTNGLGLAVSWGIVERHLGTIEVEKSDSGGAKFSVVFPTFDESREFFNARSRD